MRYLPAILASVIAFGLTVSLPMLFADKSGKGDNPFPFSADREAEVSALKGLKEQVDLNGMLERIGQNNQQLGLVNENILGGLSSISQKSGQTAQVHEKLQTVNEGLKDQSFTLGDLESVTGDQVDLSRDLNDLSSFLSGKMDLISSSAKAQVDQTDQLRTITLDTKAKLEKALQQNQVLTGKLKSAAAKSRQAANSLP
ncbi:hypothetical protein SAMN04488025_13131 [Planifilum fulgidum]|jgi:hypothetical protein|uniref:Uncharacterized protein n=1 Tax=Planifilum fulgidum TaxID=201973 RepID=A0A1I2RS45_9BACL|nr:hypothetical protein [Planifilum fulgidum]MBO2497624.1 hypothetical protein [Bacillota bacterium]MBO2532698.1 hypothetical protein [Thermoactinomycetaceae bacterium]SFG40576.1 hypothetical protein SAMN04488025_13131 [Planifilum fulgidum]